MNQANNLTALFRWVTLSVLLLAGAGSAGCAHNYVYWPTGPGLGDAPAARYPVPQESPQGEIYVTSFGFTEMGVADGRSANLLQARLAVANQSQTPWTVDGREQGASVPDRPTVGAAFLNTDAGSGPTYTVGPGESKVFDLYFAMPPPLDQPDYLPGFELSWRVTVNGQPIVGRTPFQRFSDQPRSYAGYPPYVSFHLGWGVGWWYGPYYPARYRYPPVVRTYYYPPFRGRAGPGWRGAPPAGGGWRGTPAPSGGGGWRGTPAGGGGGWRGTPAPSGGGWRGTPSGGGGGWRGSPGGGGGFRGGGGGGGWRGRGR